MGLSLGTGVQPAGGLQDIDDGLICCASLLKGEKQMSVLHETLGLGSGCDSLGGGGGDASGISPPKEVCVGWAIRGLVLLPSCLLRTSRRDPKHVNVAWPVHDGPRDKLLK